MKTIPSAHRWIRCFLQLALFWLATCASLSLTGAVTAKIVTNRVSGVAPLAVHFDASETTSTVTERPFHDVNYQWNFGDPGSGNWATSGKSKNTDYSPIVGHVFEAAGDYTVTLKATDASGASDIKTVVINVTDPDTVFGGANTICVSSSGNFTSAPSGAQQVTTSSWGTIVGLLGTGKRVLLRRGESWIHDGTTKNLTFNGPGILGAFGTGPRPVINFASAGNGVFKLGTSTTPDQFNDFRFMDLELDGNDVDRIFAYSEGTMRNVTFLRINMHDAAGFLSFSVSGLDFFNRNGAPGHTIHTGIAVVETDFDRLVFDNNINGIGVSQSMILGNRMSNSANATGGEHVLRIFFTQRLALAHNELTNCNTFRHLLKLHTAPEAQSLVPAGEWQSKYIVISDNLFSTQLGDWPVSLGPQNTSYAEVVENVIIERNYLDFAGGTAQVGYNLNASEVTARNNVAVLTNPSSNSATMFAFHQRGIEPPPHDNRVYNNSAYSASSTNSNIRLVNISSGAVNTTVRNNLLSAPNAISKAVISGSGANLQQSNNLETNTPGWVSLSPTAAFDFRLTAGSAAIDAGTSVPAFDDYEGTSRPQGTAWDLGAFEFADPSVPSVTIAANDAMAGESGDSGQFTVTASPAPAGNITVNLTLAGGAANGVDYSPLATTVVVGASGSAAIDVTPIDDDQIEGAEAVVLAVASGSGYTVGNPAFATVTLVDNEAPNSVPSITTTSLAAGAPGAAYSQSLAATGGNGALVWTLASGALPTGLGLSSDGVISGTPTVDGTANFTVRVADSDSITGAADEDTQALSILINGVPAITTTSPLPAGTVGLAYTLNLQGSGGTAPLVWSLSGGALPDGLSFSAGGVISGTPTAGGNYGFTVTLADSDGVAGPADESSRAFTLAIDDPALPKLLLKLDETSGIVAADSSANGNDGTFINGPTPVAGQIGGAWRFDGIDDHASLPAGQANFTNGLTFTVWANPASVKNNAHFIDFGNGENSDNIIFGRQTTTNNLRFKVWNGTVGGAAVNATGAITLNEWQLFAVTVTPTGTATLYRNGVQVATGSVTVPVNVVRTKNYIARSNFAADSYYDGAIDEVRIYNRVLAPAEISALYNSGLSNSVPVITTTTLPDGIPGMAYSQNLAGTGGDGALVWTLDSGTLPAGLSLSSAGVVFGTPTTPGTSSFTVRVADSDANAGAADEDARPLSITIVAPDTAPSISTTTLPTGTTGIAYSQALVATGGNGALTWTVDSGTLPAGLGLSSAGVISGTPTVGGASSFVVRVADSDGVTGPADEDTQALSLTVNNFSPPKLWLKFEEGSGTVAADSSGNGNNGTLVGGPVWTTGLTDGALRFDGVDDIVNVGQPASLGALPAMTLSVWARPETLGEGGFGRFMQKGANGAPLTAGYRFNLTTGNVVQFTVHYTTTDLDVKTTANAITLNTWQLVTVAWDGSPSAANVHIYINGVEASYASQTNGVGTRADDTAEILSIGNNSGAIRTFNGSLDDARIYDRALTPAEITALYLSGLPEVAPVITTQPSTQTATNGHTASFTVVATGTPAPTYQWSKDSNPISGATSATLLLSNVQPADAGSYTVTVTNSVGSVTSNPAALSVNVGTTRAVPQLGGNWTTLATNPDLGALNNPAQQVVDFALWPAADATWQLWSCIRNTNGPGKTRLFYRWQGASLLSAYAPLGIAMQADTNFGETAGGLQAPFVFPDGSGFRMFYGDWVNICSQTSGSADGKVFTRVLNGSGQSGLFSEGLDANTRDPMVLKLGDLWYCYYTAYPGGTGSVYARTSTDLVNWSPSQIVAAGGAGSPDPKFAAECPYVVERSPGEYYLFYTQRYGSNAQTTVLFSRDPLNFDAVNGIVCTLPVASPEIFQSDGRWYIAALKPDLLGVQINTLSWSEVDTDATQKLRLKFDEGTGAVAADSSGNGNNGALINGPVWTAGLVNGALQFDGIDDIVNVGQPASLGALPAMTLSVWAKPETLGEGGFGRFMQKGANGAPLTAGYRFNLTTGSVVQFTVHYTTTDLDVKTTANAIAMNTWQLVTVTWDGSSSAANVHIYINGVEASYSNQTNGVGSRADDTAEILTIGNNNAAQRTFNGALDDVRIYSRALSASDVLDLYNTAFSDTAPAIITTALPDGVVGTAYSQTLTATGGNGALVWSLASGTLPAGLSLSSAGVISGTPTTVGSGNFAVRVVDTDDNNSVSDEDTQALSLTVVAPVNSVPAITTGTLPAGIVSSPYSQTLAAVGGDGALVWNLESGSLPAGLSLSAAGVISGTPAATGSSSFTVRVADSDLNTGPADEATKSLSITVAPSNVSIGATGWTQIAPSADSRIVYVSSSTGSDSNDGLTPATAKATIAGGDALLRDGFPDHLLLKRGDIFTSSTGTLLGRWKNGRSPSEPMVLSYYGTTGDRPVIKLTDKLIDHNGLVRNYQAFIGLDLYKPASDPASPEFAAIGSSTAMRFIGGGDSLLVEDCRLRFVNVAVQSYPAGTNVYTNFTFRRNIVTDNWVPNSFSSNTAIVQGMYMSEVVGYTLEENFFDHNGWSEVVPGAGANMFNHNVYLQHDNGGGGIMRGNIFARGAAHGMQARSGGAVEKNLFVQNAVSLNIGGVQYPKYPDVVTFANRVTQNVVLEGRLMDPNGDTAFPRTAAVWGITTSFIDGVVVEDNILANRLGNGTNVAFVQGTPMTLIDNTVYRWDSNFDTTNPAWPHPDDNLGDYYASIGGADSTPLYLDWLRSRPLGALPWSMTAYSAIGYIREGFNKGPVSGYYEYDGLQAADIAPEIATTSLPDGAVGAAYQAFLTATGGNGLLLWSVASGNLPFGLSLSPAGALTGTPGGGGTFTVTVQVVDSDANTSAADADTQVLTFTISGPPNNVPDITTASLPAGTYGTAYTQTLSATGGDGAYTWSVASGSLPSGLSLASDGTLSGTPAATGTSTFTVRVADGDGNTGALDEDTQELTLTINMASASVTLGNLNQSYTGSPRTVSVTTIPTGLGVQLTYNGSTTTPTNAGTYAVAAVVTDANYAGSASGTLTVTQAPATLTLNGLRQAYDGTPKSVTVVTGPVDLPVSVTYDGTATMPTLPGTYDVEATIVDPNYSGSVSAELIITIAARVRHAPTLNGDLDGSIQVMLAENITLNGNAMISGDLLVLGTPAVRLNGQPYFGGTVDGGGASQPSNYTVTLNGNALLGRLVRRADAMPFSTVSAPPQPAGTRSVSLNSPSQSPGDFATIRNLTLNSNVGPVAVPPGTYGSFNANGNSGFVLGVAGSTTPVVYNFQNLTLNSNSFLEVVGPVIVTIDGGFSTNAPMGRSDQPGWLQLRIAGGGVSLASNVTIYAEIVAPEGTVTLNGNATLIGHVESDRLIINGSALLSETPDDLSP